jgi:hypothetical protein
MATNYPHVGLIPYQDRPILGPAGTPYVPKPHNTGPGCDGCRDAGFDAGLQAAREAVEALPAEPAWPGGIPRFDKPGVLAAIDGLSILIERQHRKSDSAGRIKDADK